MQEHYDRLFRNQQQQQSNQKTSNPFQDKVTGMIIVYPTLIFHLIEVYYIFEGHTIKR
jgi:hypothetical protein